MRAGRSTLLLVVAALLILPAARGSADVVRGLVVDRGDKFLWLGLPVPVQEGVVFNVSLVPGDEVIARAEVIECTPDAPYVAKARFSMVEQSAFIPVGAYAEAEAEVVADRDGIPGYKPIRFGPEGVNPLSFNAGVFFPTDDDIGDETTHVWPAFELKYRIADSGSSDVSIGVGYYHQDDDFDAGGVPGNRDFRVLPVTLDVRISSANSDGKGWYARVGAGAYIINDDRTVGGVTENTSVTTFGWQAGFGYQSRSGRFAEVRFVDVSKTDFQGITFALGARF